MNIDTLALVALILASVPCGLFLLNLFAYRPLKNPDSKIATPLSVLIPARNEEQNIRATLAAVLANRDCNFEVIILDDHSTDHTAKIIEGFAKNDSRVRLEFAPPLPVGWCGKQHACHVLSKMARHPLLVFMDADVRLAPDALARMTNFMESSDVTLASGVPRQELGTFLERLLLPQIHFILLGFLPMRTMRRTLLPSMSAGCGQLFVARRQAYERSGGHAMLRNSLHDGIKLPRVFRKAGFRTDLFDATNLATCRMYHTNTETWRGLGKNAAEGLAAPGTILPMTSLLALGQIFPFLILACAAPGSLAFLYATLAVALSLTPRLIAAQRFRQSWLSAFLHPLGVAFLLAIQWQALFRKIFGQPMEWKGRSYMPSKNRSKISATGLALAIFGATSVFGITARGDLVPKETAVTNLFCPSFELRDQFGTNYIVKFPRPRPTLLIIADKKGSEQIDGWVNALKSSYGERVGLIGVADVGGVPGPMQNMIRKKFRNKFTHTILLDWSNTLPLALHCVKDVANVFLLDATGRVLATERGECRRVSLQRISQATDPTLLPKPK